MLPLATTTVTVLRPPSADDYAEPYSGTRTTDLVTVATGVRAVIDVPQLSRAGREYVAGGEQTVTQFQLATDPCDLRSTDYLRDEGTGVLYRVVWVFAYPGSHNEGGLELVEGLISHG